MELLVVEWGDVATWVASVVAVLAFGFLVVSNVQERRKTERAQRETIEAETQVSMALTVITDYLKHVHELEDQRRAEIARMVEDEKPVINRSRSEAVADEAHATDEIDVVRTPSSGGTSEDVIQRLKNYDPWEDLPMIKSSVEGLETLQKSLSYWQSAGRVVRRQLGLRPSSARRSRGSEPPESGDV